jgi:uncharacterized protein
MVEIGLSALSTAGCVPDTRHMTAAHDLPIPDEAGDDLTDEECRQLLATHTFGRVGVTKGGLPVVVPARYAYDDGVIIFRTGTGTRLRAAEQGDVFAFEVDAYDTEAKHGWTVLALGRATVQTTEHDPEGTATLDSQDGDGLRSPYVRLRCEMLSGHRLR